MKKQLFRIKMSCFKIKSRAFPEQLLELCELRLRKECELRLTKEYSTPLRLLSSVMKRNLQSGENQLCPCGSDLAITTYPVLY